MKVVIMMILTAFFLFQTFPNKKSRGSKPDRLTHGQKQTKVAIVGPLGRSAVCRVRTSKHSRALTDNINWSLSFRCITQIALGTRLSFSSIIFLYAGPSLEQRQDNDDLSSAAQHSAPFVFTLVGLNCLHLIVVHAPQDLSVYPLTPGLWSRSRRLGLETYQRLVSVSSREKLSTYRSRLGLSHLRLVPKTNFRPNCAMCRPH